MIQANTQSKGWQAICHADEVMNHTGVAALVEQQQIAVFRVDGAFYAIGNYDPVAKANVLSRGLIGDQQGKLFVASPLLKNKFCLSSGTCLDTEGVAVQSYTVRVVEQTVQVQCDA